MQKLDMDREATSRLIRALREVDFFASFNVEDVEKLLPHFQLYFFPKGDAVFKKGQPGDAFYIVYEGLVGVFVKDGFFSKTRCIAALGGGKFFGEMALLDQRPRTATVLAQEDSKLFVLMSTYFNQVLKENPAFADDLRAIAEQRKFEDSH